MRLVTAYDVDTVDMSWVLHRRLVSGYGDYLTSMTHACVKRVRLVVTSQRKLSAVYPKTRKYAERLTYDMYRLNPWRKTQCRALVRP